MEWELPLLLSSIGRRERRKRNPKPVVPYKGPQDHRKRNPKTLSQSDRKSINTYLPMELLREIFLYNIEVNQMKSGHLASVCRRWRFVITTMSSLWSTLRVGTWTEREQSPPGCKEHIQRGLSLIPREMIRGHPILHNLLHSSILLKALASGTSSSSPHFLLKSQLVNLTFKLQDQ
jgi:F-box-like